MMRAEGIADVSIIIEDDGAGLVPAQWPFVLERGVRVDERGDGAGLGRSIVQDVLTAYHWKLDLDKSELGGLKVAVAPF